MEAGCMSDVIPSRAVAAAGAPGSCPPGICPVCRTDNPRFYLSVGARDYWSCPFCLARFLDPRQLPGPELEHSHYLLHENDPDDPRYRRFLSKLAGPLLARLPAAASGLDYGCGPGPALAAMLSEAGHRMRLYDPMFHADSSALTGRYDFITCTETAEHFHDPASEFDRLDALLEDGGLLAVMTCFHTNDDRFAKWHYRSDPTHVVFYSEQTMRTIAAARNWTCDIPVKDVAIMGKRLASGRSAGGAAR